MGALVDAIDALGVTVLGVMGVAIVVQALLILRGRNRGLLRSLPGWAAWPLWIITGLPGFAITLPVLGAVMLCPLAGCDGALEIAGVVIVLAAVLMVAFIFAAFANSTSKHQRVNAPQ